MTSVLWRSERLESTELCELVEIAGGHRLSGLLLAAVDGCPVHVVYQVDADEQWRTRSVRVTRFGEGDPKALAIEASGDGSWLTEGIPMPELEGCLDVDLEWTPATNALPIRRLGLAADGPARADVSAAWVRFPRLTVERLEQAYEPVGPSRFRYSSGQFAAELVVDRDGLVLDYEGFWRAVAHSEPERLEALRGR